LATRLTVVAKPLLVAHTIVFQQCFKFLLNEMVTIITNEDARDSKVGKIIFLKSLATTRDSLVGLARVSRVWTDNLLRPRYICSLKRMGKGL